jgi:hypothetical protein
LFCFVFLNVQNHSIFFDWYSILLFIRVERKEWETGTIKREAWILVAISANLNWIDWKSANGFPNCLRTVTCSLAYFKHAYAPPTLEAAENHTTYYKYTITDWLINQLITSYRMNISHKLNSVFLFDCVWGAHTI